MSRRLISSGSKWEEIAGYSRAVVVGDMVFVAGTTGFDYAAGTISPDPAEQTRQTLRNIEAALGKAGFSLNDAVRVVVYITSADIFEAVAKVLGEVFATIRPANTTVLAQLIDARMKIEIELTAKRG